MKFIDALYKYQEITRDGLDILYLHEDTVYKRDYDEEIGEIVPPNILADLMLRDDWEEYAPSDIHRVKKGQRYYYIDTTLFVREFVDDRDSADNALYTACNYFTNKEDAQHVANTFKRLSLIINTKRYDTLRDIHSIIQEIDREYPRLKRDIDEYNKEYIL